jgi:hypothetical protein
VDGKGVDSLGSEMPGTDGVVKDGSAKSGINCSALEAGVVVGLTNDGSARFGTSPETSGTLGSDVVVGLTNVGSARFGINCPTLGVDGVVGLTNDGSARFGASPETLGTLGADEITEGTASAGRLIALSGNEIEGVAIDGTAAASTLTPEPEPVDGPIGTDALLKGITPKRPGTNPVASPT